MSEEITMKDMMEEINSSMKRIHKGELLKGKVISVSDKEAILNIGYISDGILPKKEVIDNEEVNLKDIISQDDIVSVCVLEVNNGEGNVLLSKKKADSIEAWSNLNKAFKNEEILELKVEEIVKGGAIGHIEGIRIFIPASQIDNKYVKDLNVFKGEIVKGRLIELDKQKGKVVFSSRIVKEEEENKRKEELWNSLEKGQKIDGTVRRLEKFGAFVDIGGMDGLVHNSQLSFGRVNHPSEVVSVGDKVEVYILDFDKETKKIALSLKDVKNDPWNTVKDKYTVGSVVEGKVVKLLSFGAFVEIESGVEGLVHISEITDENIAKPSEKLNIGDKVKVKVLEVNSDEKRMSLSIKEATERPKEDFLKYNDSKEVDVTLGDLFGDKLKNLF
ncbi:30S ribosomal protein S1 [Clostridium sporogenes]|uniref:30S ribosomal protein S1 n=1 Tax=Clostridium botulinum TaxID=1491 RepID=A0A6M0SY40_CLOBO|nr:30S ribosomal protein S1 [Clostridium sporogenes]NFA60418.1 30S ribosomal protein S1 [Clostridium botulinum]NFI72237.1 30S ribosomal protein S1 [Clostridium sporogenes]NFL73963.1 30S ribosomal protein S1 [Clostridium sporogenes]NFM25575.1 30S ribosomal protein S1 [Clostridium sporogenes]NFP60915.1 30S ribosomal protein S1 [Clostridium sporogenes]